MENIKLLFTTYINLEAICDDLEVQWNEDPENEELEAAWDEAYKSSFAAGQMLINELVSFTNGQITNNIARAMIATKRDELEAIIEKI